MKKPAIDISKIDELNSRLWNDRFSNSEFVAAQASKILKKAEKSQYQKGIAYSKLNIAGANFYQSRNKIALKLVAEALRWFNKNTSEKGYVRALLLKGNIFESFGDYEKTLDLWLEAYKVSQEIKDIESEGESCSQLGLIYSRLCNFQKSLEFFDKGLRIREELGDENAVASSLNRIGMVLRQIKKYDESLEYYFRSLEIRTRNSQISAIPWTLLGIASTYEEMKMYTESLEYYEKGIIGSDKRCSLQCLIGSGRIYSNLGNSKKAEMRLLESLNMAQDLKSYVLVAESLGALSAHYELSGQPGKALKTFKRYLKAKETFHSNEIQNKLSNIEVAHAIEKSEQEKEIYRLRHVELKAAYDIIEEKNTYITASINYASRIQRAILPDTHELKGLSQDSFVLYMPLEIISGDFYWFSHINNKLVLAAGDCTGHGVPGALMSMLGISFLEEIVNILKITDSGSILDELSKKVKRALHQKGAREDAKDGMDISLCVIHKKNNSIQYSGAHNNLYLIHNRELVEYKADWIPIGFSDDTDKQFSHQEISSAPGDIIYLFSDGYADQFGGPDHKKFKYSSLKSLLLEIHLQTMDEQRERLEKEFLNWKGSGTQTDDVMIIGLKL